MLPLKSKIALSILLGMLIFSSSANAVLIDYGNLTRDSESGLDWLDLTVTAGLSYENALANNAGWRYASNDEVTNLFHQVFEGYYPTNIDGYTRSTDPGGSYAGLFEDALLFHNLFGEVHFTGTSMGMYIDENNQKRVLGVWQSDFRPDGRTIVYGPDLREGHYIYPDRFHFPDFASFLVKEAPVPVPTTLSLMLLAVLPLLLGRGVRRSL
jgi:hypothetical protein